MIKIIIGSRTDFDVARKAFDIEKFFFDEPTIDISVGSAHRSSDRVRELVKQAEQKGYKVFVACAGGSAHLAGLVASHTKYPVIGVPVKTEISGSLDSLLSMVQMPSGVPVAVVSVNGIENAVVLAVQMLAIHDKKLQERLERYKELLLSKVYEQDKLVKNELVR